MQGRKNNCLTCGKEYRVCPHCGDASWRQTACSPDCWSISQTINEHFYHLITAQEAVERLQKHHYEQIALRDETRAQIDHILDEYDATKQAARKERKQVVEATTADAK